MSKFLDYFTPADWFKFGGVVIAIVASYYQIQSTAAAQAEEIASIKTHIVQMDNKQENVNSTLQTLRESAVEQKTRLLYIQQNLTDIKSDLHEIRGKR